MTVQINTTYWILVFITKNINNIDAKSILYFSYLAQLNLSVSQKDETWLHKISKI